MSDTATARKEVAFYYPGHLWTSPDWVKTTLLFFDGIALLVPSHKRRDLERHDPEIALPLADAGLLHTIVPEQAVDAAATRQLADALLPMIKSGALDGLDRSDSHFRTLSNSRLGFVGDQRIAERLHRALKARGLARDRGEFSFPIQYQVRALVLTLVAQILRTRQARDAPSLQPATDQPEVLGSLREVLGLPGMPGAGHVVGTDFELVGVDLRAVPFDELLDFRRQHGEAHRHYAREVRRFVQQLSPLDAELRQEAMAERREQLHDLAADLRRHATGAWKRPATVGLSLAGAVWTAYAGDPWGALLAAGAAATGAGEPEPSPAGAYTYLFSANERFGGA
jgi:hypothetical protein